MSGSLPLPLLASLGIAFLFAALEILGWTLQSPLYGRLLPFTRSVGELPRVTDPTVLEGFRGGGRHVSWCWHPRTRAVLFRRRIEPARRPWSTGQLSLRPDGSWRLTWAPFPLFTWAAVVAAWFAWLLPQSGRMPLSMVVVGSVALVAVIGANLWLSSRDFHRLVWPELHDELRRWLA